MQERQWQCDSATTAERAGLQWQGRLPCHCSTICTNYGAVTLTLSNVDVFVAVLLFAAARPISTFVLVMLKVTEPTLAQVVPSAEL